MQRNPLGGFQFNFTAGIKESPWSSFGASSTQRFAGLFDVDCRDCGTAATLSRGWPPVLERYRETV